jgi:hypothetical protein
MQPTEMYELNVLQTFLRPRFDINQYIFHNNKVDQKLLVASDIVGIMLRPPNKQHYYCLLKIPNTSFWIYKDSTFHIPETFYIPKDLLFHLLQIYYTNNNSATILVRRPPPPPPHRLT